MTGSDRGLARVARHSVAAIALALASSCSDFPRTNPFDPAATLTLTVTGPDSATAIGDTVSFEVRSRKGELLNEVAAWSVPQFLTRLDGQGRFIVNASTNAVRASGTVSATVQTNEASKPFLLAQQAARMSFDDCYSRSFVTVTFTALMSPTYPSSNAQWICTVLFDRRGNRLPGLSSVSVAVRNQAVVRFINPTNQQLVATSVGSTYIVYSQGNLSDSILATVRQDFARFTSDPAECRSLAGATLAVGQSIQLAAIDPARDVNDNPITDPNAPRASQATLRWRYDSYIPLSLTQNGLVTALTSGTQSYVYAEMGQGASVRVVASCLIRVL